MSGKIYWKFLSGGRGTVGFWLDWNQRLKGYQDLLPSFFLCSLSFSLAFPRQRSTSWQLLQFTSVSFSKRGVVFLLDAKLKNPREELWLGQFTSAAHSCTNQLCSVGWGPLLCPAWRIALGQCNHMAELEHALWGKVEEKNHAPKEAKISSWKARYYKGWWPTKEL